MNVTNNFIHYHENNIEFIKHNDYGHGIRFQYVYWTQVPPKESVIILSLLSLEQKCSGKACMPSMCALLHFSCNSSIEISATCFRKLMKKS